MSSLKRAFLYDVRKKAKSLTLFLLLLLLTVSVMVGISIRSGTEKAARALRETIGASFTMSGSINHLEFDGSETGYTVDKIPIPYEIVKQILGVGGIKAYNAEQSLPISAEGLEFLSGMESGNLSANTETAYQTDFVSGILELTKGRHITAEDTDTAVISAKLAEENDLGIGSKLILKSASDGSEEQAKVFVAGIYASDSKMEYDDDTIFTTHDIFWKLSNQKASAYSGNVTFFVTDPEELTHIVKQVKQIASIPWEDYFIRINKSEYQSVAYQIQTLEQLTGIMLLAVMLIGIIVIFLVLTMRIRNRIHEAGILLSIGTSVSQITMQFIYEILMVAVLVFLVSFPLGSFVTGQAEDALKGMETAIHMPLSLQNILLQFLTETFVIIFTVIMVSLPVARMKPKDILSKMS